MRIERIGLEHHGDAALGRGDVIDGLAADRHFTARDVLEPGDHAQEGGFSAARGADEDDEFSGLDLEIHPMHDLEGAIGFADIAQLYFGHDLSPVLGRLGQFVHCCDCVGHGAPGHPLTPTPANPVFMFRRNRK
jgi:hypothetical protein